VQLEIRQISAINNNVHLNILRDLYRLLISNRLIKISDRRIVASMVSAQLITTDCGAVSGSTNNVIIPAKRDILSTTKLYDKYNIKNDDRYYYI